MSSVQFLAEISSNHHQSLERCLRFVDVAADIGCWGIKIQAFKIDLMFTPGVLVHNETLQARRAWEFPLEFVPSVAERCKKHGLVFVATPFYLDAVEELRSFVDVLKIASYELPWDALIRACAQTGKPLVLSTGMATVTEIDHAVSVATSAGVQHLVLLHCISAYPAPAADCNLRAIEAMRQRWLVPVGWSDHARDAAVLLRAALRWQAAMIECHLDLDGTGAEYAAGHCWLPEELRPVIAMVRDGEAADGDGIKHPAPSEMPDRPWRRDPKDGLRPMRHVRTREDA